MTPAASDPLCELLAQSLPRWHVSGDVCRADNGMILLSTERHEIRVEPAPSELPFRWLVTVDGRQRPALSVVAVLRQVREALDPGYATQRVRIAAFSLVPT
jgi:hypothetical protein